MTAVHLEFEHGLQRLIGFAEGPAVADSQDFPGPEVSDALLDDPATAIYLPVEQQLGSGQFAVLQLLERRERHDADIAAGADQAGAVSGQVLLVGLGQTRIAEGAGIMRRARQQDAGIDRPPVQVADDLRVQSRRAPLAGEQALWRGEVASRDEEPINDEVPAGSAGL